jgi:hypothetical protein
MNTPEPSEGQQGAPSTSNRHRHTQWPAKTGSSKAIEVPAYGSDGDHQLMVPVEIDEHGSPPRTLELLGCDSGGRLLLRHYVRNSDEIGWVYVQSASTGAHFGFDNT